MDMISRGVSIQFTDELQKLLNKYGVDNLLRVHDFVLAHTIQRFLNALSWMQQEQHRLTDNQGEDIIV